MARSRLRPALAFGIVLLAAAPARAQDAADAPLPSLVEAVRVQGVGRSARTLVHTDAIEAEMVAGTWLPPRAGAEIELPDGTMRRWTKVSAGADGAFEGDVVTNGSWLSFRVPAPTARTVLLHAVGHDFVYVNGTLRAGDPYGYGAWRLPIPLRAGDNELLFRASRGRFRAALLPATDALLVEPDDTTVGQAAVAHGSDDATAFLGAVVVTNTTGAAVGPVELGGAGAVASQGVPVAQGVGPAVRIPPLGRVKLPLRVHAATEPSRPTVCAVTVRAGGAVGSSTLSLRPPTPQGVLRVAYTSRIDGSVQYVAVRPATGVRTPALILSLHGASVEATGQAAAYGEKPWALVAAPTNRRPFGFDWEDWGRIDALEALEAVRRAFPTDPARTFLSGHSMGGHGTWHLGVTFPDRWAAIGPSAGWVSFFSYGGAPTQESDPVLAMLRRAASPSDTLALAENLADVGVYALHGDADDNVPVTEMRTMLGALAPFHADLRSHEQPGAGHWWDLSNAPGADCVDWDPMMAFFARRAVPDPWERHRVDFATMHPGVSASCAWVTVEQATRPFERSRVRARRDVGARRVEVTTENVEAMSLDLARFLALSSDREVELVLDGVPMRVPVGAHCLVRDVGAWARTRALPAAAKRPARCGPFKAAFDRAFALVYGTAGTPEETAWGIDKTRLDAETWLYRGNGLADVMSDAQWLALPPAARAGRNVVLYGHRDANAAWASLLGDGPVDVRRDRVVVGGRTVEGAGLACLFVRPRADGDDVSVGVVAGTGLPGLRLTERLPYLSSGVGVPDLVVLSTAMLEKGGEGVLGAGFFGNDWSVERGTWAWR